MYDRMSLVETASDTATKGQYLRGFVFMLRHKRFEAQQVAF